MEWKNPCCVVDVMAAAAGGKAATGDAVDPERRWAEAAAGWLWSARFESTRVAACGVVGQLSVGRVCGRVFWMSEAE